MPGYIGKEIAINTPNPPNMYLIVWKYEVKKEKQEAFEQTYGPTGAWQQFFEHSTDHIGSFLYRGDVAGNTYLLIDRWESKEAYESYTRDHLEAYNELNERCRSLYEREEQIGSYRSF
jgi:heme-degrading monooxygenase HmoA